MKKFFIRIGVLLGILWVIFYFLDDAFEKKALEDKCRRSVWSFSFQDQHFDFVVSGSSRAYNMIDIPTMMDSSGQKGLNLAYSGTGFEEQYLILRKFVENGNSIDQLFLQTDIKSFNSAGMFNYAFHDFNYLPYLDRDTFVANVVQDNTHPIKFLLWKYVPFVKYMEFNLEYPLSFLFKGFDDCRAKFDAYGSELRKGVSPAFMRASEDYDPDKLRLSKEAMEGLISDKTYGYFKRIIKLCEEYDIELILYTPPIFYTIVGDDKNRNDYKDIMQEMADRHELPYYNYLSDSLCFDKANFYDAAHTNRKGSIAFSAKLSDLIN